jgi:hypothetical protein
MIECRGRNGWFRFHRYVVLQNTTDGVGISLFSRVPSSFPPIYIEGPKEDLANLLRDVLREVIGKSEKGHGE